MTSRAPTSAVPPVIAPVVPSDVPVRLLSPIVLAYVGDAVFEVYVRQRLIAGSSRKPHELHRAATKYVSAAAQAKLLQQWSPLLTEEEADVVRRGRNTKSGQPPRNADPADYRQATALECLVGYLYYEGQKERLEQLMELAFAAETE
ncbi:Mini-ribonuclease 3 [Cohnella sp.]|uniref:Mini-ribonuclease 3 n=1 Tax=Cohnella sp. TaxID=1883426 RepID=UPI0035673C9E